MKQVYEFLEIKVIPFLMEDIITASTYEPGDDELPFEGDE